jgi:hypothetical protein
MNVCICMCACQGVRGGGIRLAHFPKYKNNYILENGHTSEIGRVNKP